MDPAMSEQKSLGQGFTKVTVTFPNHGSHAASCISCVVGEVGEAVHRSR